MSVFDTEKRLDPTQWIDRLSPKAALQLMLANQRQAGDAVELALPQIEDAVTRSVNLLSTSNRGRIIYCGAGTSARIAVQDGAELLPTFNWPRNRVDFIIAGGASALMQPIENAEDEEEAARKEVAALKLSPQDIFIAVAASGHTRFTVAALCQAQAEGAHTIGIANNPNTPVLDHAANPILLHTGAEALAGSTRLKAGTAQKICLNLYSTEVMVLLGYVKNGMMSEMQPRNEKLRKRKAEIEAVLQQELPSSNA